MHTIHKYALDLTWTGNKGTGTSAYADYDRSHEVYVEGKPVLLGSSDPVFRGDATKYNPEELFLASIAACHMLWYLHLCADAGITVTSYKDQPAGVMDTEAEGGGRFISVTLHPVATITQEEKSGDSLKLHDRARELCFIANSCNFPVVHHPQSQTADRMKK